MPLYASINDIVGSETLAAFVRYKITNARTTSCKSIQLTCCLYTVEPVCYATQREGCDGHTVMHIGESINMERVRKDKSTARINEKKDKKDIRMNHPFVLLHALAVVSVVAPSKFALVINFYYWHFVGSACGNWHSYWLEGEKCIRMPFPFMHTDTDTQTPMITGPIVTHPFLLLSARTVLFRRMP